MWGFVLTLEFVFFPHAGSSAAASGACSAAYSTAANRPATNDSSGMPTVNCYVKCTCVFARVVCRMLRTGSIMCLGNKCACLWVHVFACMRVYVRCVSLRACACLCVSLLAMCAYVSRACIGACLGFF